MNGESCAWIWPASTLAGAEALPQRCVVADRFHLIRLINHHFLARWKELCLARGDRYYVAVHQKQRNQRGFHTKMEVPQRLAYGHRNDVQNYRLRVRVMCS
jgi:hypothetical protein